MNAPDIGKYDVVLQGKCFLRELIERLTLEERLDEISCRTMMDLAAPNVNGTGMPTIAPGHTMEIIGAAFGETSISHVFNAGPVWDVNKDDQRRQRYSVTVYDKTIYLAKSEDEYLFAEGTTATQRIKQIAGDWNIPVYQLAETGQPLAKALYRSKNMWSIIQEALRETAEKSGKMYRLRMMPGKISSLSNYQFAAGGLELVEIGSNSTVWMLESQVNMEKLSHHQTLDGAVTKVKILGNASKESRSPVLGVVTGETQYGTLQKVHTEHKATNVAAAMKIANNLLTGVQETINATGIDINTIRAGDRVAVEGYPDLLAVSVKHECGSPGSMMLQLAPQKYVRSKYYARRSA